jgi:hypothetical protein
MSNDLHLSDQEMLLVADGELSAGRANEIRAHLTSCWSCRGRMAEIEGTIATFARAYRQTLDPQLSSISGPRALLGARLAELASKQETSSWRRLLVSMSVTRRAAFIGAALVVTALVTSFLVHRSNSHGPGPVVAAFDRDVLPNRKLTPGATRKITALSDVCTMVHEEVVEEVPTSLRQEVFQRYGIVNARATDYEIDYLIAPGLGGVGDISNLWPESYASGTWNAHVKDELEERLHEMVCNGEIDLSVAQRDIAIDWIAAYKKYFHTNRPLAPPPSLSSVKVFDLGTRFRAHTVSSGAHS